jgi:ribosome-associated protein
MVKIIKEITSKKILDQVLVTLDDGKGQDIKILDLKGKTNIADFMVVVSGTSERHVRALASHVVEDAKLIDVPPVGVEGELTGEWVLVDLGDVIVHVMKPQTRDFYQLEKFWQGEAVTAPAASA